VERRLLIERIQELQREIAQISAANHAYFACHKVNPSKKLQHERRHKRLQEIKEELAALRRPFRGAA
jgi:ribosomal protein L29